MNRPFNKIWKETIIISLCFVVLGGFMLTQPKNTLTFFSDIVGALILMLALIAFYKSYKLKRILCFEFAYGVVCGVGALVLFFNKTLVGSLLPIVLGVMILVNSVFKIPYIFSLKKSGFTRWWISIILCLLKITFGLLLILNPFASMMTITQVIGILIIMYSICDVIDLLLMKYCLEDTIKSVEHTHEAIDVEVVDRIEK